jgi:hypothetical protein
MNYKTKLRMARRFYRIIGFVLFLSVLVNIGCDVSSENQDFRATLQDLYAVYLEGDTDQARESLHQAIHLLKTTEITKVGAMEHGLWLEHSRLHVLEKRAGNYELADGYLLKAQYWYLRKLEASGDSTEEAIKIVRHYTPEKCTEVVDGLDNNSTDGRGPAYGRN